MSEAAYALSTADLDRLIEALRAEGLRVVGPVARDGVVHLDEIETSAALPRGLVDRQAPGSYRLEASGTEACFAHTLGQDSWKQWLFPPRRKLFDCDPSLVIHPAPAEETRYAFLGVRACDLAALAMHDRVFAADDHYRTAREAAFVIAVHCRRAASTCFCDSMGTGPEFAAGYDLLLTERLEPEHTFDIAVGTARGQAVVERLALAPLDAAGQLRREEDVAAQLAAARAMQVRRLDPDAARDILARNLESARWDDVAQRCLACANCTLVCPTCFCSTVEDTTDLSGEHAERWLRWDSCFNSGFTQARGGSFRTSVRARYRQWLTHKLSTWHAQFGASGCVGCGRCIAWCPAGIDLVAEVDALHAMELAASP
jgi:ferredoxin